MADSWARPVAASSFAGHLLVLERPLTGPSAAHALRLALARCRRGERVTVYLTETALSPAPESTAIHPLQELLFSGGRVLAEMAVMGSASVLGGTSGIERASENDLATLLLIPGVDARWC
jgi:hypothetical protein